MTGKHLEVWLYGRPVADLEQTSGGQHVLTYRDEVAGATPVSLSMPVNQRRHPHRVVEPFLSGLLPDSDDVRVAMGREFGVNGRNPFALLHHVGLDCAGAVQFRTPGTSLDQTHREGALQPLTEQQLGRRLQALDVDGTRSWVAPAERWSLAGAQGKFAVHRLPDGTWAEARGATPTTHIVKPGVQALRDQALNEHVCLRAAALLGLDAAESMYHEFDGHPAIIVTRYDRRRTAEGEVVRIHQEDLCQALSVPPERKYETDGGPGVGRVLPLLIARLTPADRLRFTDFLAYNYLIGGSDAHAKNFSLLLVGRQVRLAPLYDVASAFPYQGLAMSLPMAIGGERRFGRVRNRHWAAYAVKAQQPPDAVIETVRRLARDTPDALRAALVEVEGQGFRSPELQTRLLPAVAWNCASALE